jgi:ABC-type proline/glycine betaine transport system permease subunit
VRLPSQNPRYHLTSSIFSRRGWGPQTQALRHRKTASALVIVAGVRAVTVSVIGIGTVAAYITIPL